jgi:hypothetical protein
VELCNHLIRIKKDGIKNVIVGAGTNAAEIEMWVDAAANGQWAIACPRTKGIGSFFPSSSEQECTIRIDGAPGITMHCSAIQEISGWTKGAGGAAAPGGTPSSPAPAPAPTETAEEPQPDEGGGGEDGEESGGGSDSNYTRVNRSYRSRVRYY